MKTNTHTIIYELIRSSGGITPRQIITAVKHHPTGIFKHLKALQDKSHVYKVGKMPKVRYYAYTNNMPDDSKTMLPAMNWAASGDARFATEDTLAPTRDVLHARTERLIKELKKILPNENLIYLLTAVAGEIGNNSFDHNLGQWQDTLGVFFQLDTTARTIIIADRGQGVLATIRRVRPDVLTDDRALEVAFTEMVSGRAPEKRGNGLKFVKKVISENYLHLTYYTGTAMAEINRRGLRIKKSTFSIPGTLAIITF